MANNILSTLELVERFNKVWAEHSESIKKANASLDKYINSAKIPSNYTEALERINKDNERIVQSNEKIVKSQKKVEQERLRELRLATRREKAFDKYDAQLQRQQRSQEKERQQTIKNNRAWVQLTASLRKAEDEYKDLAAALGTTNEKTIQAQREVQRLRSKVDGINEPIRRFGDNVGNYPNKMGAAIGTLKNLIGAFGIIEGLRFGYQFAKEAVLMANAAKGIDIAFGNIANSEDILLRARRQTRGLISDLDLKKSANEFKNFNLNVEELPTLLEFVTLRSIQTGKSVEGLRDSLVEGLAKESTLRIDNLGISIADLNKAIAETGDFTSAVASIAKRELAKAGTIIDDSVSGVQQWNVALENTQVAFGKLLNSSNLSFISSLASQMNRVSKSFDDFRVSIAKVNYGFSKFTESIDNTLRQFPILYNFVQKAMFTFRYFVRELTTPALSNVANLVTKIAASFGGLGSAITEIRRQFLDFFRTLEVFKNVEIDFLNPAKTAGSIASAFSVLKQKALEVGGDVAEAFTRGYNDVLNTKVKEITTSSEDLITSQEGVNREVVKSKDDYHKLQKAMNDVNDVIEDNNLLLDSGYLSKISDAEASVTQRDALLKLRKATEDFIRTVGESSLGDLGMGSLTTFFDGTFDTLMEGADTLEEKFAVTFNAVANVAKEAFSIISSASQQSFDNQFRQLETQKEVAIQFSGDSATAKAEIDRQYEEKRAAIQRKQAESQKKMAIFNIITSTAQGVVGALASAPPNIPLSIAVGLIGATQASIVAGTQIPEFKDGVRNFSGGHAIVGDGGKHEYIKTPDGKISKTPNKDTLVNLPKGSDVYKDENDFLSSFHKELGENNIMPFSAMISRNLMPNITNKGITKDELKEVFSNEINRLNSTIKNKNETQVLFDENGMNVFSIKNGVKAKKLNARVRGRGNR